MGVGEEVEEGVGRGKEEEVGKGVGEGELGDKEV